MASRRRGRHSSQRTEPNVQGGRPAQAYEIETPKSLPTPNVTSAANPPSSSIRAPDLAAPRPVKSDSVAPTANKATAVRPAATKRLDGPARKTNGTSGIAAPSAKESSDDNAAP